VARQMEGCAEMTPIGRLGWIQVDARDHERLAAFGAPCSGSQFSSRRWVTLRTTLAWKLRPTISWCVSSGCPRATRQSQELSGLRVCSAAHGAGRARHLDRLLPPGSQLVGDGEPDGSWGTLPLRVAVLGAAPTSSKDKRPGGHRRSRQTCLSRWPFSSIPAITRLPELYRCSRTRSGSRTPRR
jgi:hypothetical protein